MTPMLHEHLAVQSVATADLLQMNGRCPPLQKGDTLPHGLNPGGRWGDSHRD